MEKWILAVNYHHCDFEAIQEEWLKSDFLIQQVDTFSQAMAEFTKKNFSLVILCSSESVEIQHYVHVMKRIKSIPIVVDVFGTKFHTVSPIILAFTYSLKALYAAA